VCARVAQMHIFSIYTQTPGLDLPSMELRVFRYLDLVPWMCMDMNRVKFIVIIVIKHNRVNVQVIFFWTQMASLLVYFS
jgi:hypothetical protein